MAKVESISKLLQSIDPIVRKAEANWKRAAPGFKSFALFDPKETVQTRIIAGLLDPNGNHGQGDSFLRLFLIAIEEGSNLPEPLYSTSIETEVLTRSLAENRRRIDLLISLPTGRRIAIESKARGAVDQPKQLEDYISHVHSLSQGDCTLVYLSPHGRRPSSVPEVQWLGWMSGERPLVRCLDYDQLMSSWLKSCESVCCPEALALRGFLIEFARFSSSNDERSPLLSERTIAEVSETVLDSRENLMASIAINNSHASVVNRLAHQFIESLKRRLLDLSPELSTYIEDEEGFVSLRVGYERWNTFRATFQIGPDESRSPWHENIYIGVQAIASSLSNDGHACAKEIEVSLSGVLQDGKPTKYWTYYQREYSQLLVEGIAGLLYEPPLNELDRLSRLLQRIVASTKAVIDAFELGEERSAL
jgi:hypothetical protein